MIFNLIHNTFLTGSPRGLSKPEAFLFKTATPWKRLVAMGLNARARRPVKCASVCSSNEHRVATDGQAVVHARVRCDWTTHDRTNRQRTRVGRVEHNHAEVLSSAGQRVFPAGPQTQHQHIGDLITAFKITDLISPQSSRCNGIKSTMSEMRNGTGMRNVQSYATKLFTCGKHAVDGIAKVAYFTAENVRKTRFWCRTGNKL